MESLDCHYRQMKVHSAGISPLAKVKRHNRCEPLGVKNTFNKSDFNVTTELVGQEKLPSFEGS